MSKRQEAEWMIQRRRQKALDIAQKKEEKLLEMDPEMGEVEQELLDARQALLWASLKGEETEIMKETIAEIEKKKEDRLHNLGLSPKDLLPPFTCTLCDDTGRVGHEDCQCMRHLLMDLTFSNRRARAQMEKETFEQFDLSLFRGEKRNSEDLSPRQNMAEIKDMMVEFCDTFPKDLGRNFLFYGPVGTGKTYLCHAIAQAFMEKGTPIIYRTAYEVLSIFQDAQFGQDEVREEKRKERSYLQDVDVLIIDDLGTESIHSLSVSYFFQLFNDRILAGKTTIISTNLEPIEIQNIYSPRIFSRLYGEFEMYNVFGDDLRLKL